MGSLGSAHPRTLSVAVLVVAAVLLTVAVGLGLFGSQFAFLSARPAGTSTSLLPALHASNELALLTAGGPWQLFAVDAIQSSGGIDGTAAPTTPQNCSPTRAIPAVPADPEPLLSSGVGRYWTFSYLGSNGTYLWVTVVDGSAQVAQLSPATQHCVPTARLQTIDQSTLQDSPGVAHALGASYASYAENHTVLASEMFLGNYGLWTLSATACAYQGNVTGTFPVGPNFEGVVNSTTLSVVSERGFGPATCA